MRADIDTVALTEAARRLCRLSQIAATVKNETSQPTQWPVRRRLEAPEIFQLSAEQAALPHLIELSKRQVKSGPPLTGARHGRTRRARPSAAAVDSALFELFTSTIASAAVSGDRVGGD